MAKIELRHLDLEKDSCRRAMENLHAQGVDAIINQLKDSYEFLFNTLGPDHKETWECYQQYQRAIRW